MFDLEGQQIPREDIILFLMTATPGSLFNISQFKTGMFLISKTLPELYSNPYDWKAEAYGPHTQSLYDDKAKLIQRNLMRSVKEDVEGKVVCLTYFMATNHGFEQVKKYHLTEAQSLYIWRVADWVLKLSMTQLISSIVKTYPEYGTNLLFSK